jgi:hypothetical protein
VTHLFHKRVLILGFEVVLQYTASPFFSILIASSIISFVENKKAPSLKFVYCQNYAKKESKVKQYPFCLTAAAGNRFQEYGMMGIGGDRSECEDLGIPCTQYHLSLTLYLAAHP